MNYLRPPSGALAHLVDLQVQGFYGRKWVEHQLGEHLDLIGRQVQDLEGDSTTNRECVVDDFHFSRIEM